MVLYFSLGSRIQLLHKQLNQIRKKTKRIHSVVVKRSPDEYFKRRMYEKMRDKIVLFDIKLGFKRNYKYLKKKYGDTIFVEVSGVVISSNGYILSCAHMFEYDQSVNFLKSEKVRVFNGQELNAKLIGMDTDYDLALFKVQGEPNIPFASFAELEEIKTALNAYVISNSLGCRFAMLPGTVCHARSVYGEEYTSRLDIKDNRVLIQTDISLPHGSFGGPIISASSKLMGILIGSSECQNVSYGIHLESILEFLDLQKRKKNLTDLDLQ